MHLILAAFPVCIAAEAVHTRLIRIAAQRQTVDGDGSRAGVIGDVAEGLVRPGRGQHAGAVDMVRWCHESDPVSVAVMPIVVRAC